MRVGAYRITAELRASTTRRAWSNCWSARPPRVNLQMAPTVAGNVTVTGEAPLLETTTSASAATSIRGRCRSCRCNGRNWMALALLAPGSRTTSRRNATDAAAGPQQRRGARVPAQPRRPAGVVRARHRRPAAVQPGLDRRIPVHLEPVRRDAGPLDRRAGERDHQVGHQPAVGSVPRQLPRQPLQRRGSGAGPRRCRSATSSTARRSAARSSGTGCTTSATSNTSASRGPASGTRRTRRSTSS